MASDDASSSSSSSSSSSAYPTSPRWRFGQCFGEKDDDEESEADVLTAVEFDSSGDFLATGDKGGRVVVFERVDAGKGRKRPRAAAGPLPVADEDAEGDADADGGGGGGGSGGAAAAASSPEFRFLTEFQSQP